MRTAALAEAGGYRFGFGQVGDLDLWTRICLRREIHVAASLQHPHIVPLLSAGQAGELLYYTVPLVEGELLRARLRRDGEPPVAEAVRVLRDVDDTLS